ncbi:hypothetical protein FGE12_06260 [Aggregicoccus sp. 17bor-14]|uniref:beta strand repeat-containing protein n=1 Tax=Myxococcaceae TaxID=31 RepID=UPI00129C21E4|nr:MULTISPECIES: hypothetical protein [Myxococcaceae]MBF5041990.1 hypothetical protein [Simulacricoccus sp. 17bor-14]MRI87770.1 hypothetical protein [Aggregicoccus sp. 17bor-14]
MSLKHLALALLAAASFASGCKGAKPHNDLPDGGSPPAQVARKLAFTAQPTAAQVGAHLAPSVQVTVQDADGNTVTAANTSITLALGQNAAGASLSGLKTVAAVNGVATFTELALDKAGEGYTLVASASGLTGATSAAFSISAAPQSTPTLAFSAAPDEADADGTLLPEVTVAVKDAQGHTLTGALSVSLALGANPSGATLQGTLETVSVNGVATFQGLSITQVGEGYTLVASAPGAVSVTSAPFRVKPGAARSLAFVTQPSSTVAGSALAPAVQVAVRDVHGNTVTASTASVTLALSAGSLAGTRTVAAVNGVATFPDLSVAQAGTSYTLAASSGSLTGATSAAFAVSPGAPAALAFRTQPAGGPAGATLGAVEVEALDASGNLVPGFAGEVSLSLGEAPSGAVLSGTASATAAGGVARFADLSLARAAARYTLVARSTGLVDVTSAAFAVTPGAAARLAFGVQPSGGAAGQAFSPAVQVWVEDALGNLTDSSASVTLALTGGDAAAQLSGALSTTASSGVATFAGLSVDKSGMGYQLVASSTGLPGLSSATFAIVSGVASRLAFLTQPTDTVAGAGLAADVVVQDALGNRVLDSTASITVSLSGGSAGASLQGTRTASAVDGVAHFSALSIETAGTGYQLTASAAGHTGATSSAFAVTPAAAHALAFTAQPASTTAGVALGEVQVTVQDAFGNVATGASSSITLALGGGSSGATLAGSSTVAAVNGVATFTGLSVARTGTGYVLTASSAGLTDATSSTFDVAVAAASRLAFAVEPPESATAAEPLAPSVQVRIEDAFGNAVADATANITLALSGGDSSAVLSGTRSVSAVAGVATFPGLSVDLAQSGYRLEATSAGLTAATSRAFTIVPGSAARLAFRVQPTGATAGATLADVEVAVLDAHGNTVPDSSTSVALALAPSAPVSGLLTELTVGGIARFSGLSVDRAGSYTLTASATDLTAATSASFDVAPAAAAQLAFTTQPASTPAGQAFTVEVAVQDRFGNRVTSGAPELTLALHGGSAGASLSGTSTASAASGLARFTGLSVQQAGTGYTLSASSAGVADATSVSFDVAAGSAARLVFSTPPQDGTAAAALAAVVVTAQDGYGNTAADFGGSVTVALGSNPGVATLGGTTTVTASAGVATFSTLTLDRAGSGYTLAASATALSGATSPAFTIAAGAPSRLAFSVQPPASGAAGVSLSPAVEVSLLDAQGNLTPSTASVTLALGANPGSTTLGGTTTVAAVGGVARFTSLQVTRAASGYTLSASSSGLSGATSSAFSITAGAASRLTFVTQPSNIATGAVMTPAVQVAVEDAFGNRTASALAISLGLADGSSAVLSGTLTRTSTAGLASFGDLSMEQVGTGFRLTASATGLGAGTSTTFDVTAALGFAFTEPTSGKIRLMRNPASTSRNIVLDLVTLEDLTGYSVGMNLPLDTTRAQAGSPLMTNGSALPAGSAPTAAMALIPTSGPLQGVLVSGQSQKASGAGAVLTDTLIPAGSVLYTLRLSMPTGATEGVVFDGASPGAKFRALLRNKLGEDVVAGNDFAIGKLELR